jgi:HK97 family phage major capsid protein
MATIESYIADIQARIAKNRQYIETVLDGAKRAGRSVLSKSEDTECERRFGLIDADKLALSRAQAIKAEDDSLESRLNESHPTGAYDGRANRTTTVSVTREARTYNKGNDPKGTSFLRDVARAQIMGDAEAYSRLARHMQEERVERPQYAERAAGDLISSGIGGVMVPQYLVDETALAVAARRPFADACTPHNLPAEGMSLVVPVFTTGTAVGNQTTQLLGTGIGAQSMVESDLTLPVYTAAGYQNVSRQSVDRSRIDEFVLNDLMTRYATNLDNQLLNMATVGLSAKASSTLGAYADTQPTGAKLYPKLLACASGVEATTLGGTADLAVMHSRRWNWLAKEMTTSWPLINSQGIPTQASGVNYNKNYGAGFRGVLPNGMAVVVDNNVSTVVSANQDEVYVVPSSECHLYEDANAPAYIRCDQTNAAVLGVLFVVYGYYAFTFDRYGAGSMQKVSGTGLTTPTF